MFSRKFISLLIIGFSIVDYGYGLIVVKRRPLKFHYVGDLATAASHGATNKNKNGDTEEGRGDQYKEVHHRTAGKKDDKGDTTQHEVAKGEKSQHDVKKHEKSHDASGEDKKRYHAEKKHQQDHRAGEKTSRKSGFDENGAYQRGHSTKGHHNIFKKNEYAKQHDFFDEFHESAEKSREGGYRHSHGGERGGHHREGHRAGAGDEHRNGTKKVHKSGRHYHVDKSDKNDSSRLKHQKRGGSQSSDGGDIGEKRWQRRRGT